MRTLLFKHAYGYDLALLDFGRLTASDSLFRLREPIEQHVNRLKVKPNNKTIKTEGMNFLLRDFGIIRVKTFTLLSRQ